LLAHVLQLAENHRAEFLDEVHVGVGSQRGVGDVHEHITQSVVEGLGGFVSP
jgi:hypothetical protein